ncbi:hypothetical protein [Actinophytocola oryzae]|uniref:Uncharacterized protein n=1 Tax=Actinophytocola oryzae TaxID=502181 RepID=A0A4R7UTZ8_9PSEU|nr:hypothetical protein [Actinophytocola oryzae]TDV40119.1 hypothetical protein CLV71_124138 [Actinophytocola oryzae]
MTIPTATEPAPMPHPNDDGDFAAARQAPVDYQATVDRVREDPRVSDLGKAERIAEAYSAYISAMDGAWERLQGRRQARHDWLAGQVPTGHGIAEDASPADRAALMAAFRGHYDRASSMDMKGRAQMLDEADRFGDEPARRAALTAIVENGEHHTTLRSRPDRYATVVAHLDELGALRGNSAARGFEWQTFRSQRVKQPREIDQIPELQAAQEARHAAWRRAGQMR